MARSVCDADPRSIDQRRAHALTAAVTAHRLRLHVRRTRLRRRHRRRCAGQERRRLRGGRREIRRRRDRRPGIRRRRSDAATAPEPPRASAKPAYVFGAGIMPTALLGGILERARIREVRHPGANSAPEPRYTPITVDGRVRALPRSDVPLPWLRQTRPGLRHRPHRGLPGRPDTSVEPEVPVPLSPFAENVLERSGRLARPTTARRNHHLDQPDRPHLCHLPRQPAPVPAACVNQPPPCGPANHPPPNPPATAAP